MRHVLITGASSGIGAALALVYAAPGTRLDLWGRDAARLEAVAATAAAAGASVAIRRVDVADVRAVAAAVEAADDLQPLDLVIANAGMSNAGSAAHDDVLAGAQVLTVNLLGAWATAVPAARRMRARGHGQLALVGSLAGNRGLPYGGAYGASKAGIRVLAESLRAELAPQGIKVSAVTPGFVRTPLTDKNRFAMPWLVEPADAAARIRRGLERDRPMIAFPWPMVVASRVLRLLPPAWVDPLLCRRARAGSR
jgi:short-subunit dehydrogenase